MKDQQKKTSSRPWHTVPGALAFLYLTTFALLLILGLVIVFLTGYSAWKLAVLLVLLGVYLIALVFAVLLSRNVPKKHRIKKYRKLLKGQVFVEISSLAERTGLDPEEVLQDLQLFIDRGIYPDGKISEDRKIFYPEHSNTEPHGKDTL